MKDATLAKLLKITLVVGGVSALAPMVSAEGIGVQELQRMLVPTPQKVERGERLYDENCATCHGQDGSGMAGVRLADTPEHALETTDFTAGEFRYGGGLIQIYNAFTFGLEEAVADPADLPLVRDDVVLDDVPSHPKFQHLHYQSRWDIAHYIQSLGPADRQYTNPEALLAQAEQRAREGVCDEEIKGDIASKVAPTGPEQLERGAEVYAQSCASCHGDAGEGDGPAAGALQPPPRDFVGEPRDAWTQDPSPLGIFNVLANGVPGTSMAAYSNMPEEDRWALTHYVLEWVPDDVAVEATEDQVLEACRALSAPEPPEPVPVSVAMRGLIADQVEQRHIRLSQYEPVQLHPDGDPERGERLFVENCVSCHGAAGSGQRSGPYGAQPPFLYLQIDRLAPAMAGGTAADFARRSSKGAHATLPNMTPAALLSDGQWRDLQAYVATLEGDADITVAPDQDEQGAQPSPDADGELNAPAADGDAPAEQPTEEGDEPAPTPDTQPAPDQPPSDAQTEPVEDAEDADQNE